MSARLMTASLSMLCPASLRLPGASVFSRLADVLNAGGGRERVRAELRHRLRTDARLRRDIGLSRFDLIRLSTAD